MPSFVPDAGTITVPPLGVVYVWECLAEPRMYALCINQDHTAYQTAAWKPRGEFSKVAELSELPGHLVDTGTVYGWPMTVCVDQQGTFSWQ